MAAAAAARKLLSPSFVSRLLLSRHLSSPTPFLRAGRAPAAAMELLRPAAASSSLFLRFRVGGTRSMARRPGGDGYSPARSGGGGGDRAPTEMAPLFPGCDYEHWLIVMDKPGGEGASKQQMIDCYVHTLAKVLGSEEEAKKKIYNVSCERYFGFGCEIDEETSNKLEGIPGVLFVLPDSYVDHEHKDCGVTPEPTTGRDTQEFRVRRAPREKRRRPACLGIDSVGLCARPGKIGGNFGGESAGMREIGAHLCGVRLIEREERGNRSLQKRIERERGEET